MVTPVKYYFVIHERRMVNRAGPLIQIEQNLLFFIGNKIEEAFQNRTRNQILSVKTELSNTLMDDLAWSIYEYLLDESTDFQGEHIVLLPITVIARKFDRNHRTISRRLSALRDEGLIKTIIKKDYVALYHINDQEDND